MWQYESIAAALVHGTIYRQRDDKGVGLTPPLCRHVGDKSFRALELQQCSHTATWRINSRDKTDGSF